MGYDQLMRPQRAGQGGEYATLNPKAVSPAFLKSLINCNIYNDLWETEPGAAQMNDFPLPSGPTVGTVYQWFPNAGVSRIIAVARNGTLWVSTDDGKTFQLLSSAMQPNRLVVPVTGGSEQTGNPKKLFLFGGGAPLILAGDAGVDSPLADPTVAPTLKLVKVTGAVNTGDHNYVYTFGTAIGESAPSPINQITVNNPNQGQVMVGVPAGPAGTTYRKIYRSKATGDLTKMLLLHTINDNTTIAYQDNFPDGSLGTQLPPVANATSSIHPLARPPADWNGGNQPIAGFILEGRMAGFGNNNQQHGLYYSTLEDHEDFLSPGSGFLPVFTGKGDGITAGVYWRSQGWLFKAPRGIYRVDTSDVDPTNWQLHEHSDAVGCVGPMAITLIQGADDTQFYDDVVFIASDGSWHRMSKTGAYQSGDVNASSISEATYGQFIRVNVDKTRLPFAQLIYFDAIEEVWGAFTQLGGTINKLRIKASLKRLPEFGVRFHHSTFPECEGLTLIINPDATRTPIAGGGGGIVKRAFQQVYADAGLQYQSAWETWDDDFQDLGENYKVSKKNYHFLVIEGIAVGDWTMFVEVYIDGVLQPTVLSVPMKGTSPAFILDQSHLDQQALGEVEPLFVVKRLRARGHRIRYRGYISTEGPVPILDNIGFGQLWTHELGVRSNTFFPAASVFVSEFTVFAFHRAISGIGIVYDRSDDGGQTFPTTHATASALTGHDVVGVRYTINPDGSYIFLLLMNESHAIFYSTDLLEHPEDSTWTEVSLQGTSVGAPIGFEVNGLTVQIAGQSGGGGTLATWHSEDGGKTFTGPVFSFGGETMTTAFSYNVVCSPAPNVWLLINANTGKIYRTTDNGVSWALVKTVTQGNATLDPISAIIAVNSTRIVAVHKGQITVSNDAGATWTDKQNLTLAANSPLDVKQAGIGCFCNFGKRNGVTILGGASNYMSAFGNGVTRGAAWRSVDLGETWTIVDVVNGASHGSASVALTAMAFHSGRGVIDLWNRGATQRDSWYNPSPIPSIGQYFKIQQIQTGFSLGGFSMGNKP